MIVAQEVIRKKRDGERLSQQEIEFMVHGNVHGNVPDYQLSALMMAIYFRGLDTAETRAFLTSMIASGDRYDWSRYGNSRTFVDKHSTGGVGDKTSLVILPLLVADGLDVPMISGRGLSHTGGTADKLESLPGFSLDLDHKTFSEIIETHHAAFGVQTERLVPADKKMYALRDVTATVENIGLITASILSKKIAEGVSGLVLDVKFGSGAFMRERGDAEALARNMISVASSLGCTTIAALTNMNEPLGLSAGNSLEVVECLDVLAGAGPRDTRELSLQLAAGAAAAGRKECNEEGIRKAYGRMRDHLDSGRAYEIFLKLAVRQGAKLSDLERRTTDWIHGNTVAHHLKAKASGKIVEMDTREIGLAIVQMGGGRARKDDKVNPFVGLTEIKKIGDEVQKGDTLCVMHVNPALDNSSVEQRLLHAIKIGDVVEEQHPLIDKWMF